MTTTDATSDSSVRITDLDAMQLKHTQGQSLVRITTDRGVVGYGEAGGDGPTVRGQLQLLEDDLLGEDPLEIEKLYDRMTTRQHVYRPHAATVSGVDIALWDLCGKLLDRPISSLLRGQFRDRVPFYLNGSPDDMLDTGDCEAWVDDILERPGAPYPIKTGFNQVIDRQSPVRESQSGRDYQTLTARELTAVRDAAETLRGAMGRDIDLIVHCHNEWDLPSAIGLAEAVAPADPLWIEDPLPVEYDESWCSLRSDSPVRVLTGEKLEFRREFHPFLENGAVDIVQPDLAFAGGITGGTKIAELADLHNVPVTAHDVGSLVLNAATVHFGASVRNFWMAETRLSEIDLFREMGATTGLDMEAGAFTVPDGPGLGISLDEDVLRKARAEGEPYWE